jgi:carboxyl-terminal processing protease
MRKLKHIFIGAAAGAAVSALALTLGLAQSGGTAASSAKSQAEVYKQLELFGKVFDLVRADYVDVPDESKLITSALNGMINGLDPHSSYMDPKNFRDMQEETSGEFGGLGMQVSQEDGLVKVVSPIDDTPAARAGVRAGDVIVEVAGEDIKGLNLTQVVEKLRGPVGTSIQLKFLRKDEPKPIELSLTREIIKVASVRSHPEGDDIGYIRITQFNNNATDGLKKAIRDIGDKIAADHIKGYILDLRNNPGGLLDQAVGVSDVFMTRGEIVSIRGRQADDIQRFDAKPGDLTNSKPLIVLVNGGSASASEIVAGALQDQKRATVLGTQSFGKGSVQTIIPLGSGNGALRLTTARYYTPSGRSIQAKGITPDIEVLQDVPKSEEARFQMPSEAGLRGHLAAQGEGDEQKGSQSYVPPNEPDDKALQAAIALIRGTQTNPAFPPNPKQAAAQPTP